VTSLVSYSAIGRHDDNAIVVLYRSLFFIQHKNFIPSSLFAQFRAGDSGTFLWPCADDTQAESQYCADTLSNNGEPNDVVCTGFFDLEYTYLVRMKDGRKGGGCGMFREMTALSQPGREPTKSV